VEFQLILLIVIGFVMAYFFIVLLSYSKTPIIASLILAMYSVLRRERH